MRTLFPLGVVALTLFALPGALVFLADLLGYGQTANTWLESRFGVSHRLALGLPAAVTLACVPPLIVLLYFLRLRRKPVAVSSTFLWQKSIEDLHVNRLMQWIRRNVLLLLQLLAAFLMLYGVLGPRLHGAVSGGRYYILLLDNSASMTATDVAPTRLDWAKQQALREIDAATDADTGMVIAFNDTAEIRQSYTTNRAVLRRAVEGIQPTQRGTRLDEALSLAASLANPSRSTDDVAAAPADPEPGKERTYVSADGIQADLHLFSDGRFPPVPEFALQNLSLIYHTPPAGSTDGASDNVGVLRLDAERNPDDPATVMVRATIRNYRDKGVSLKPRLEIQDTTGRVTGRYEPDAGGTLALPAKGESPDVRFTLRDVPENTDATLHLTLDDHKDALAVDDQAWVVLGVVRKAKVLVVGPANPVLRYAMDGASVRRIAEVSYLPPEVLDPKHDPKEYATPAREGRFDLIVYDRCAPPTADALPPSNTLLLGAVPPGFGPTESVSGPIVRGWQGRHPVMRHLSALDEIDIAEGMKLPELPPRSIRLIEGSQNLVLLAAVPRQAYTDLVLAFPLMTNEGRWNTNWPLRVSFPLWVRNVLLSLGNVKDAGAEEAIKPGQPVRVRAGGATLMQLTTPDGNATTLDRGTRAEFTVTTTDRVGVYASRWSDPGGTVGTRRWAVNLFDPVESDLAPADKVTVGNTTVQADDKPRKQPIELWKWPVLLGLLALVGEWWIYNKRVAI